MDSQTYSINVISGTLFGVVKSFYRFPFTSINYNLKANGQCIKRGNNIEPMKGYIDSAYYIYHKKGILGYYGMGFSGNIIDLLMKNIIKEGFRQLVKSDSKALQYVGTQQVSSLITNILTYPLSLAVIGAVTDTENKFDNFIEILKKAVVNNGITGLFTGLGAYLIADKCLALIRRFLLPKRFRGTIALSLLELLFFPFQYIQIRMIVAMLQGTPYTGMIDCLTNIIENQGCQALFTGVSIKIFTIIGYYLAEKWGYLSDAVEQGYQEYKNDQIALAILNKFKGQSQVRS